MASRPKLSGMQKQVLGLYRGFLRAARLKPPEERRRIESIISARFRQNAKNVDRKNFLYIEYLMQRGKKQLEQLRSPDIVGVSTLNVNPEETLITSPATTATTPVAKDSSVAPAGSHGNDSGNNANAV